MSKRLMVLLPVLVMAGCAGGQKQETLGDLGELDIKIDTESPIEGSRNKAMDNYWEFMAGAKEESEKAEAMRRLADLEMERSEERFQKQMDVIAQGGAGDDADIQNLREITFRGAIKLYEDALKLSSGGEQAADLLYQVSKAYEQAGWQKKALDALDRLLVLNPRGRNRDELQFRRGELLFDLRKFKPAELAYTQVISLGASSRYYEKAITKQGWTLFKQGKYQLALKTFFALADRKLKPTVGLVGTSSLSRGDREVVDDVFRIVTLTFDELGGAKAIKAYFDEHGNRDYEIQIYQNLAEFYVKKKRVRDAAETYQAFAVVYPMHERAFEFDLKAIQTYTKSGFASVLIEEKRAFTRRYRVNGPYWKEYEEQEETILADIKSALRGNSEDVVRHLHAEAQKSKTAVAYQTAFIRYRQYLKWFGQSNNAQKLNFLYAELLFEAGYYEKAAKEYEKTAYRYLRFGKDAEAGYAALLAYSKAEKKAKKGKQKATWSRLAVGSAMRFGKTFPGDKRAGEVLTKAAQDMFALKKFNQAAVAARQILELSSGTTSEARRTAWKIIARAEFEKGDYTRAEVSYKVALSLTGENEAGRRALKDGLAASVYKQGEYMKSKGNLQGAIAQFARVQEVSPNSVVIQSAEFDIAASMLEAKNWVGAINKFLAFRNKHPAHQLSAKVSENLVKAYLKNKQPLKAAVELESLVVAASDPEIKRGALWQAAELYEKSGGRQKVIAIYKRYVSMFPEPMEQATEARNKLAVIYGKSGRSADRRYWLQEIIRRDKNAGSSSTPRTQFLAATASLELAEPLLQAFQKIRLVRPLKQNLRRKKQKMKAAVNAYTEAADYGIAEITTASVYWLAEIYNEFGRALMKSERPTGLSEEELEQYDILLEEQAYPFEEKSINIHESNVGRVSEGMFDEWIKKSLAELRELSPIRYSKFEKSEPIALYIY